MLWNERIKALRKELGLTQMEAVTAANSFLPSELYFFDKALYSWESGRTHPNVQQAMALARAYGMDVDLLFGDGDGLNELGRRKLSEYHDLLLCSPLYKAVSEPKGRAIPFYLLPASAGTGQFLDGDEYEMLTLEEDAPENIDYAIRVSGDSMEPRFHDGDTVYVHKQGYAESGDIVICYYDGQSYIKKLRDTGHKRELVSLNKNYAPIPVAMDDEFRIFGIVVE